MYYHVLIETNEKLGKSVKNRQYFELDRKNLLEIEEDIIVPYLLKKEFQFDGYFLNPTNINRVVIKKSELTTKEYSKRENEDVTSSVVMYISPEDILDYDNLMEDITKQIFLSAKQRIEKEIAINETKKEPKAEKKNSLEMKKVFIVHGHDDAAKSDVARFIEKLGFEAIILHEQVSGGDTVIEKIENNTDVGFGVVLYTPCDLGAKNGEEANLKARARQNVVFEHGYLIAKLGRRNVCALVKGNIETPNDISGVVYVPFDSHKAWKIALAKELRNSGFSVDMNLII